LVQFSYFSDAMLPSYGVPYDPDLRPQQIASDAHGYGWVLRLRPKINDATNPREAEYMTTAPYFYRGELYVATFIPRTRLAGQSETCPEVGDAKLYILNPITGKSRLSGKDHILLRDIKIVGISARKGFLYLGIQQQVNPNSWNNNDDVDMVDRALLMGGTMGRLSIPTESINPANLTPNIPYLHYWRERIHR
jgi:hypothetical protein